jgi:hypothetical protein
MNESVMPVVDVVVLPRGRLVEGDARVVLGLRGDDEAGDGLLEGGVEGLVVVGHEGGLRVVEEGGARGEVELGRRGMLGGQEVDARRRGPLGALLEEDLGERVRREGLVWVG